MKQVLKEHQFLFGLTVFLSLIYAIASVLIAKILQRVTDTALSGDFEAFKQVILFSVGYLVFIGLGFFTYTYVSKLFTNKLIKSYRQKIFHGVFQQNYQDFTKNNTADYLSILTNDMKMVEENFLAPLLGTILFGFIFVIALIMLFIISPLITVCLIISVLFMFLVPSIFGKLLQKKQNRVSQALERFTKQTKDLLAGFEVIKTFNRLAFSAQQFEKENEDATQAKLDSDKLMAVNESLSSVLGMFSQFVVIFVSSYLVIKGEFTMGGTIALIQLSGQFVSPLLTIMTNVPKMKGIQPVIAKLDVYAMSQALEGKGTLKPVMTQEMKLENVSFAYDPEKPILSNIDLTLEKGKKYVIMGKSGCGKSTLTKLISGYYDHYEGDIHYDGQELKELDQQQLGQVVATIHQDIYMFDTTIKNNLCLYQDFSDAAIKEALANSGAHQFIAEQAEGIDSMVGENGAKLSGGQRQRLAVARALIQKTPVLIIDEGTSAIDKKTAYDIESKLFNIKDLTLITITHQTNADLLKEYDEIIYMEHGNIIEKGHFNELMANQSAFYQSLGID
ncbi:ABC transporter ATP-binding protein [Isobaculum melis]|uniref:ABC-type multidrug transport system, ATPase and permease component n=1 Tax=Isobaculum melis TaxID=142588 RepID=A0A1H9U8R9_9LACT|nr:ABC transporter ATP-binding protein [Isobaculum melis]SES05856.1 ABC-type multidrug transport system, ATPase and permease component [Isobaculum melis]